jgi:hypothetical protein
LHGQRDEEAGGEAERQRGQRQGNGDEYAVGDVVAPALRTEAQKRPNAFRQLASSLL